MPATTPQGPAALFATLNGLRLTRVSLRIPGAGVWSADVELAEPPEQALPTTPLGATLEVGDAQLTGTVLADEAGAFAGAGFARIVGGAGGWAGGVVARAYHNDAGVTPLEVLTDLAADAGETLAPDVAALAALLAPLPGVDYARQAGGAGLALDALLTRLPAAPAWWVDTDGATHVGARAQAPLPDGVGVDLLEYSPLLRTVELAAETLAPLEPGLVISDARLSADLVVREVEILVGDKLRVRAWVDEQIERSSRPHDARLARVMRALVMQALPRLAYLAPARYRVANVTAGRANLQVVDASRGLPDLVLVRQGAGVPGASFLPALGSVVLVAFVEGDPSQPVIMSYPSEADAPFAPVTLSLAAAESGGASSSVTIDADGDAAAVAISATGASSTLSCSATATTITATTHQLKLQALEGNANLLAPAGHATVSGLEVRLADATSAIALAPPIIDWAAQVVAACAKATPPIVIPPLDAGVAAEKVRAS